MPKKSPKSGISIVVPQRSTGRLVDALTDLIRPFSEARGLKADQIRLQREVVAIEIAKRAKERLAAQNAAAHPVRSKVLVPLIEAASTEDLDDEFMIDKWANLLASATQENKVEPRFVGILKELTGRQPTLLDRLARNNSERFPNHEALLADAALTLDVNHTRRFINNLFRQRFAKPELNEVFQDIADELDRPGCAIMDIMIFMAQP